MVTTAAVSLPQFVSEAQATAVACGSGGTPSVTALANPTFYIDSGINPQLNATYAGYTIRANSSETNLRIVLSGFENDVIQLATSETGSLTVPTMTLGSTYTAYFLLRATGPTTTAQTHDITLYRGATPICTRTYTYARVTETIKALANKVDSVSQTASSDTFAIGDTVTVTVQGRTGTLGAGPTYDPGVLSYAPTAVNGFPANAWRLEKTELTIKPTGVEATTSTFIDRLYLTGASGPDRPYTAKYYFRSVGYTNTPALVKPIQYIASGTQVKHTDVDSSAFGALPPPPTSSNLQITKSASVSSVQLTNGQTTPVRVQYTVSVVNSGGSTGYLDRIVDTLPGGATYVSGLATFANRAATPTIDGQDVILYGQLSIAAGGTVQFKYSADITAAAGTYINSAVGYFANATIDNSTDITSSNPATASVVLLAPAGQFNATDDTTSTSTNIAKIIDVLNNDDLGSIAKYTSAITLSISQPPSSGTVSIITSGVDFNKITYTPNNSFGGTDQFKYTITYGSVTATAQVTVNVPKANYDEYVVRAPANGSTPPTLTIADPTSGSVGTGLVSNDFCPTNQNHDFNSVAKCTITSLTADSATGVSSLTLSESKLGGFTYTGTNGFTGNVSFTYVLRDANGSTATGKGRIVINDFGPDRAVTPYKTAVSGGIHSSVNDYCGNQTCTVSFNGVTQSQTVDGTYGIRPNTSPAKQ